MKRLLAVLFLCVVASGAHAGNVLSIGIGTPGAGGGDLLYTAFGKINTAVNGVANCWASPSAPSFGGLPENYQCWWNTTSAPSLLLNFYDGTSWVPAGTLNTSTHTFTPQGGATCTGDMTGTFPACTLPTSVNSNVGTYGSASAIPSLTVNNKGQVTAASSAALTFSNIGGALNFSSLAGSAACLQLPALTGNVTTSAGSCAATIPSGVVTLAMHANLSANSIIGNNTGSPHIPIALTTTQIEAMMEGSYCMPSIQIYQTGGGSSGTYTTPTCNSILPSQIEVEFVAGGGGGGGSGSPSTGGNGAAGGTSSFGTSLYSATGGGPGLKGTAAPSAGGVGGVGSGCTENLTGQQGTPSSATGVFVPASGGSAVKWGIGGVAQPATAGPAGMQGGGGSGGASSSGVDGGGSGGGGGYCHAFITSSIASTYPYVQGAGGVAGTVGTSGSAGGAGGDGYMIITARWQ